MASYRKDGSEPWASIKFGIRATAITFAAILAVIAIVLALT